MQEFKPAFMTDERSEERRKIFRQFFAGEDQAVSETMEKDRKDMLRRGFVEKKRVKIGRNEPCPCGSGLKFKKCCFSKVQHV